MIRCKELLRYSQKRINIRPLSTTDGGEKDRFADRGEEAEGAMREWITNRKPEKGGFFSKIRDEVAPSSSPNAPSKEPASQRNVNMNRQRQAKPGGASPPQGQGNQQQRQGNGRPGRVMNKRFPAKKAPDVAVPGYQGASSSANQDDTDGGGVNRQGGRNRRRGKDDDFTQNKDFSFDSAREEDVPPEIKAQLLDHEFFMDLAHRGKIPHNLNTDGMDPVEEMLALSFFESMKTKSNTYETVMDGEFKKTKLPKARNMRDLMYAMQPKINSAERGTEAYNIAEEAWGVINKNIYFTEAQKYQLTEGIARMSNRFMTEVATGQDREFDLVLQPQFKKGPAYMEEERRIALMQDSDVDELYVQDDTDWGIDAVEDEDQL